MCRLDLPVYSVLWHSQTQTKLISGLSVPFCWQANWGLGHFSGLTEITSVTLIIQGGPRIPPRSKVSVSAASWHWPSFLGCRCHCLGWRPYFQMKAAIWWSGSDTKALGVEGRGRGQAEKSQYQAFCVCLLRTIYGQGVGSASAGHTVPITTHWLSTFRTALQFLLRGPRCLQQNSPFTFEKNKEISLCPGM